MYQSQEAASAYYPPSFSRDSYASRLLPEINDLDFYLKNQARADATLIQELEAKFDTQGSYLDKDDTRHLDGALKRRKSFADQFIKSDDYKDALKILFFEEQQQSHYGVIGKTTGQLSLGARRTFELLGLPIPSFSKDEDPPPVFPQLPDRSDE